MEDATVTARFAQAEGSWD